MNKIKCPYCLKQIEVSEALNHELQEEMTLKFKNQLENEIAIAKEKAKQDAGEQLNIVIKSLQEEITENKTRNKKLQDDLMDLMKQLRTAQKEKDEAKLEAEKQLSADQEKIRHEARSKVQEEYLIKDKEKDLKIDGLMKALEDAQRKANQGSQQSQGEALELELENQLKTEFPNDKILEVKKGQKGGDLIHEVWDRNGIMCGTILWEFKNTANWTDLWIDKLKQDQRSIGAETAIIISEILPKEIKTAGYKNGVWVTTRKFALVLAMGIRANLIQVAQVKKSAEGKNEKMEILFKYFSGTEFSHRMEALAEAFNAMQEEIEKEKRYFSSKWARDEKNIRLLIDNTQGMRGELDSIMRIALPEQVKESKN